MSEFVLDVAALVGLTVFASAVFTKFLLGNYNSKGETND